MSDSMGNNILELKPFKGSEELRLEVSKSGLTGSMLSVMSTIAAKAEWKNPTGKPVKIKNFDLARASNLSIRRIQEVTKKLVDCGYIFKRTVKAYSRKHKRCFDEANEYTITPLIFYLARRTDLVDDLNRLQNRGYDTDDVRENIKALDEEIDLRSDATFLNSPSEETLRGQKAQKIRKLNVSLRSVEEDLEAAQDPEDVKKARDARKIILDEIEKVKSEPIPLRRKIVQQNQFFGSNSRTPPMRESAPPGCEKLHTPDADIRTPRVSQTAYTLNTHSNGNDQSYDNSHSMKKSQKGLSEVLRRMAEMNLFGRYSQALKQPAEIEKNQKSFGLTVLKCCGSKLADIDRVFQDLEEALKLVETSKALQDPPESGGYHSLGRLLFLEDLKKLDASSRLKYCQEARNFGGTMGMAYGAERMARAYGWNEGETGQWLSNGNAGNVSRGDQGDEVSKHKSEAREDTDSTGVTKDSQTGEPSEALRGSGNERDESGDIQAPDRDESDFQRRFRERRERSEQGGFLAGEGIENRPLAEPKQESETEKPAKYKPTKALKQFNEQLRAGKLASASIDVYEKIQASGKEAEAGADHAREPEKVQPEDVKKPAPESSEAGSLLQRATAPMRDSAVDEVIGPENVVPQDGLFTHANGETETTPAGKTSQYDFNVPAAEMSAASNDPKNITTDSCLLSNQSGRNVTKNPESELNLGGTGNSGGRNKPAADNSTASKLLQERSCTFMKFDGSDLAAGIPESPAGSVVGGFEREEQRPETPEESSQKNEFGMVDHHADSASNLNASQAPQNLKPDALKSSGLESKTREVKHFSNSTLTDPALKKSKPESATEPGEEDYAYGITSESDSTLTDPAPKKSKPESATEPGQVVQDSAYERNTLDDSALDEFLMHGNLMPEAPEGFGLEQATDAFTCTEEFTAESRDNADDKTRQNLTTASPGFDETAPCANGHTVGLNSESVDENFNGSVAAREKTSAARDCDGGGENAAEQCGRAGETGESATAGSVDPSEPRNGETVTDYALRACRVVSGGDNALWRSLWMEVDSLETDAEKIDWAEQKLREKYSKEHDITHVA